MLLAAASLMLVMTCAGAGRLRPGPSPDSSVASRPASSRKAVSSPAARVESRAAPPSHSYEATASQPSDTLARFHQALSDLSRGRRGSPLRILWLGDSHTAADYWPDAVRQRLGARFGNGGPGFVRVGAFVYRHAKVQVKIRGRWLREPSNPAVSTPLADRIWGLGGMRFKPRSADASARVQLASGATRGGVHWELVYRLPDARAGFQVALDGGPPHTVGGASSTDSGVQHLELSGSMDGDLSVEHFEGVPELMGAFVESTKPGVVVDTVGIDGARAATLLAWDEASWIEQVRRRSPTLAVLAFGTNEVLAPDMSERYGANLSRIVERLRRATPELDCLFIGPTPLETHHGSTHSRVMELDEIATETARSLGCRYFSPYQAMGGEGGYARWSAESPTLTAHDRVHLNAAGYTRLGNLIADQLEAGVDGAP